MSIIGKNIKKLRVLYNLNQQDFGKLFKIGRGSVGSYEEGRAEPKLDTVMKIAKHFHLSIDKLLTKELTVNEMSDYANIISKHINSAEQAEKKEEKPNHTKLFLEQRVAILEEKLAKIEKILRR